MSLFTALHRSPRTIYRIVPASALASLTLSLLVRGAAAQEAPPVPPTTPPPATPPATAPPAAQTNAPPAETVPPLPPGNSSDSQQRRISFGPELGVYFPTASKTSKAFGSAWINYGVGLGAIHKARVGGEYQFDIGLFGTSRSEHRVYMAPIGVSYRRALSENENSPYVGASLDAFLTQIRSDPDGIISRIRGTEGGSLFIGETFRHAAYVQARYLLMGEIRGYNLSGLNLAVGYRF